MWNRRSFRLTICPRAHRSGRAELFNRLSRLQWLSRSQPLILVLMSKLPVAPFVMRPSYALVVSLGFSMALREHLAINHSFRGAFEWALTLLQSASTRSVFWSFTHRAIHLTGCNVGFVLVPSHTQDKSSSVPQLDFSYHILSRMLFFLSFFHFLIFNPNLVFT